MDLIWHALILVIVCIFVSSLRNYLSILKYWIALLIVVPLGYLLLSLIWLTLRVKEKNYIDENLLQKNITLDLNNKTYIFLFWHEYQILMPFFLRQERKRTGANKKRLYALISQHRDGRIIALIARAFGVMSVAGSSSRGGRKAYRELVRYILEGHHVALTPDGPKGPRRIAKEGAFRLAQACPEAIVIPLAFSCSKIFRLKSWDRMIIPKPFSEVQLIVGKPFVMADFVVNNLADDQGAQTELELRLNEVAELADKL